MDTKIIKQHCFANGCDNKEAEVYFFKYLHSSTKTVYYITTTYCKICSYKGLNTEHANWNFEKLKRFFEMYELGMSHFEVTNAMNSEFKMNLQGKQLPNGKGFRGAVQQKLGNLRPNDIVWDKYTDDNLLIRDVIIMFKNRKESHAWRYDYWRHPEKYREGDSHQEPMDK